MNTGIVMKKRNQEESIQRLETGITEMLELIKTQSDLAEKCKERANQFKSENIVPSYTFSIIPANRQQVIFISYRLIDKWKGFLVKRI